MIVGWVAAEATTRISCTRRTVMCPRMQAQGSVFNLQTKGYMRTKEKLPSKASPYELVQANLYATNNKHWHIVRRLQLPELSTSAKLPNGSARDDMNCPPCWSCTLCPCTPPSQFFFPQNAGPNCPFVYFFRLRAGLVCLGAWSEGLLFRVHMLPLGTRYGWPPDEGAPTASISSTLLISTLRKALMSVTCLTASWLNAVRSPSLSPQGRVIEPKRTRCRRSHCSPAMPISMRKRSNE